jgi:beta-glucanase (GH16 family)
MEYFSVSTSELGSSWVFDHRFYILVNLAIGGWLGGEVGDETAFPAELKIDYIRVYEIQQPRSRNRKADFLGRTTGASERHFQNAGSTFRGKHYL